MAIDDMESRSSRVRQLRDRLWAGLQKRIPGVQLNGAIEPRLPHNLNITIPQVRGVRLQRILRAGIACSSGSACSNGAPSHVLQAIGRTRAEAEASLRLSLGRGTTEDEVDRAVITIAEAAEAARGSDTGTSRTS